MIRVAVVAGKLNTGGKKNLIMEYYRHIDKSQIQFDFICDSDSQAIPIKEIEQMGGKVYIIAPYQHIFKNMSDLHRIIKTNRYPIVHAYNSTMNVFSMYVAKKCKVPVRISESLTMAHKNDWKTVLKKMLKPISKWFANHYVSCGRDCGIWQFGKRYFLKGKVDVFKTVVDTKFNSFNLTLRNKTRKEFGWENKIVIGHIGRFTIQKNSIHMIEIFGAVAKKEPNAVLCLIGDGELKTDVMNKIKELGIEKQVDYLGKREDIQQFYNAMDCFILPSLYEGLPVVGLEAECCGLPVFFSTEVTSEASACDLGYFIDLKENVDVWADVILKVCAENMSKRKSYAKEVFNAGFDSSSEAKRLQRYYLDLVSEEQK